MTFPDGSKDKLLTKIIDTVGREVLITWANVGSESEPKWRIVQITDPIGRVWQYQYDQQGNLWKVTDSAGRTTTYGYTSVAGTEGVEEGLLASMTTPMGKTVQFEYRISDPLTEEPGAGFVPNPYVRQPCLWVSVMTEPSGLRAKLLVFSDLPGVLHIVGFVRPDGTEIPYGGRWCFGSWGRTIGYFVSTGADMIWEWDIAYTLRHSYSPMRTLLTGEQWMTYDTVIDEQGQKVLEPGQGNIRQVKTLRSYADPSPQWLGTQFEYWGEEKLHQRKATIDPLGRRTEIDYYPADNPNPRNRGNVKQIVDAKLGVTSFEYNQYGQQVKMIDAEGRIWRYEYDLYGNLKRLIYPDGSYTETTYDLIGRPIQIRDRKGQVTTITYNAVGQPVQVNYADGSFVSYTYNEDGQVTSVTDSRGTTSYTYDNVGRLVAVTDPEVGTMQYEYDLFGMRTKVIYPNGWQVRYEYEPAMVSQKVLRGEMEEEPQPMLRKVIDPLGNETMLQFSGPPIGQLKKCKRLWQKTAMVPRRAL